MGLAIERVQRDPWELEAVRRLSSEGLAGLEYYRALNPESLQPWELQYACELSLVVEQCVRCWELMKPGDAGRPKRDGLHRDSMREARRERYRRIWSCLSFAATVPVKGDPILFGAVCAHTFTRHLDRTRYAARLLDPLEAFDVAYATGGIWWAF